MDISRWTCFVTANTNCDTALWNTQTGTHIATLDYAGHIFSLELLSDSQLASGNRDEPSLREPISESGRASSSYTDYDAVVMLGHIYFILYTQPDDVLLNGTAIGHKKKLCNRPVYRFKSAEDTSEGHLQDSVSVLMTPKRDLLEPQAIDQRMDDYNATEAQNNFAAALNPRDDCCIFTDINASILAAHIIPFRKQDEVSDYQLHIITIIILSC